MPQPSSPSNATPDCQCGYCAPEPNKLKLFMCQQRWDALPYATRVEITESVSD